MQDSEKLNTFSGDRNEFKPYGLTCELWKPDIMHKADRHNEIEINYFTEGGITYLFRDSKIKIPAKCFTIFWGLLPHQIVDYSNSSPYFVCTIPLSTFLEWKLPASFVDRILKGEVLFEDKGDHSFYDEFIFKNWIMDYSLNHNNKLILLEMQARLIRMAERTLSISESNNFKIHTGEISKVEEIALFIAQNYHRPIRAIDISQKVGLHPDYANVIFKKAFGTTINEYIIQERISHAQRKLITSDNSITDIVYESGFNSISRFNAAFRKINKCTPRDFKKRFK